MTARSTKLAARLWWLLLPYAGETGYADAEHPARWFAHPLTWLWQLVNKLPSSAPFEPHPPVECDCDYCRGVPGAGVRAVTALLIDALSELGGLTITVRHDLEPACQRLMDTLGVTVRIDESAPACSRYSVYEDRNRSSCARCHAIEKRCAA